MKNKIQLKEGLEIKNYRDFIEYQIVAFKLIEGVIDEMIKDTLKRNPTFIIPEYDKLIDYNEISTVHLK